MKTREEIEKIFDDIWTGGVHTYLPGLGEGTATRQVKNFISETRQDDVSELIDWVESDELLRLHSDRILSDLELGYATALRIIAGKLREFKQNI